MFGEVIPIDAEHAAKHALRDCDLFIATGTSGTVAPGLELRALGRDQQRRRVLLDLKIFDGARDLYGGLETGPADELVSRWFD
jgi:NAD-dependent deacetylase